MQFLYMYDCNKEKSLTQLADEFFSMQEEPRESYVFAEALIAGAIEHIAEVDKALQKAAKNWKISRMGKVDLAILRLAIFELLFRNDIPPIVSINEAIDLSKTYSGADSKRFVNGVLDNIKESLDRPLRTAKEQ